MVIDTEARYRQATRLISNPEVRDPRALADHRLHPAFPTARDLRG
jgi:hypothetical protein